MNNSLILHDTVLTLGYNPYAQRYLVASDAESNNISTQEVAAILMNTPEVTKKTYLITTPGRKNNKAVSRMTELLGGPAGSKVR